MDERQWPQYYYKHNAEDENVFSNSTQSFYNIEKQIKKDCSQCYYHTGNTPDSKEFCPQCYYHHEDEK